MIDKTGPIASSPSHTPRDDRATAGKSPTSNLVSGVQSTSLDDLTLSIATAQLSALRNQVTVASASGNLTDLRNLAERAVSIGVAAGANAESLAGEIAAKLASAMQDQGNVADQRNAVTSSADRTTANMSALGLDPDVIAQLFDPGQPAGPAKTPGGAKPVTIDPVGGLSASDSVNVDPSSVPDAATGLNMIASLNYRASSVITEARSLLASMNLAIKDTVTSGGGPGPASSTTIGGQEAVSLNGLAELLDQAESSMTAHILAATRQIGGGSTAMAAAPSTTEKAPATPGLNLKA